MYRKPSGYSEACVGISPVAKYCPVVPLKRSGKGVSLMLWEKNSMRATIC